MSERRTIGHYLLLVLAVLLWIEMVLFFTAALHNAGRDHPATIRFGILTIGVFVSGAAAAYVKQLSAEKRYLRDVY